MPHSRPASKILVVDDDPGLTRLIERALQREGYDTAAAASGEETSEWLQRNKADLLLLDLKLPDIEGPGLIETLQRTGNMPPFIVITGQGDERVAVDMMKRGARDYLVKDASFIDMLPMVVARTLAQIQKDSRLRLAEEALRRQEAFNAAVMAASGALLIVLDADGRCVSVNDTFLRMCGCSLSELRGQNLPETVMVPGLTGHHGPWAAELPASPQAQECEGFLITKSGERRWIAWSVTVLSSPQKEAEHVIVSGIDITDRRRLEEEILQISERERERIGQDLHDDLGQQLVGAWCMSQALSKGLASKRSTFAQSAVRITAQLKESVALTRALARGLHPVALESGGVGSALAELAQRTSDIFSVDCRCECPPGLEIASSAAIHLYRIAQEAVTNAVKHGHAREIAIEISSNPHQTVLSVRNDGASIPETPPAGSSGMGLRIMKYRAGVIGGSLAIQNNGSDGGVIITCAVPTPAGDPSFPESTHGQENNKQSKK